MQLVHAPVDSSGCFQASSRTFYSLARPDSSAAYRAPECSCHGLSETILNDAKPTQEVIVDMISFIRSVTPQGHKAVLLVHNGNIADFPHLLAKTHGNDIPLPAFIAFYGDTLAWAKLSHFKPGPGHALSLADFKLTTINETLLAKQRDNAHHALDDALALHVVLVHAPTIAAKVKLASGLREFEPLVAKMTAEFQSFRSKIEHTLDDGKIDMAYFDFVIASV
jgi:DNA polymerase III epsilon subunit-like protein